MIRNSLNICHERWANLHPLVRLLALGIVMAALALVTVKPGYHAFKEWRLEQNLTAARKAFGESRMNEARDLSMTVLRAGDPRIDAFRILEESTRALHDSRHSEIARALMSHPEGSDEDRLTGFQGLVMDTPLGLVGQAWVALSPELKKDPRFAVLFADRLISEKHLNEAASVLIGVPEAARTDALNRGLIRVMIRSGRKEGFDEAQRLIAVGMRSQGADLGAWLDLLEEIPPVSLQGSLLDPVRSILENPSNGDPARHALMLARMDYAAQFTRRAEILEKAVAKWKDANPVAVANFLSDLGLYQQLLETIPPEQVGERPVLFSILLNALEKTSAWEQVLPMLDAHGGLLPKAEELAHRAIVIAKTGNATGRSQAWQAAIDEAKSNPQSGTLLKLHRIAENARMPDEANMALVEAIRLGRGPLPLYADLKSLLAALQQQERENILLEICAIYLQFEPGNPVLLTQYAYLACLNNLADPATILKAMEPMAKAFPKEVPMQCVLATAYLCGGQNAKAAETLDPLKLHPAQLPPSYRVALLVTRILNGRMTASDPLVRDFPWKSMLPSERRKFGELIRTAGRNN